MWLMVGPLMPLRAEVSWPGLDLVAGMAGVEVGGGMHGLAGSTVD